MSISRPVGKQCLLNLSFDNSICFASCELIGFCFCFVFCLFCFVVVFASADCADFVLTDNIVVN